MSFPQKAPEGAIYRTEPALDTLNRVKHFHDTWIKRGISKVRTLTTCLVRFLCEMKSGAMLDSGCGITAHSYSGISVLPYFGGTYPQLPFEDCDKETYERMLKLLKKLICQKCSKRKITPISPGKRLVAADCEVK